MKNISSSYTHYCSTSFDGSWKELDKSVIIVNWNNGKRDDSMPFFAQQGYRQIIAGYYDSADVKTRLYEWLNTADKIDGVFGIMYTTWTNNYGHMEMFYQSIQERINESK